MVVVRRPHAAPAPASPGQRKPLPAVEAFFTTDLTLSLEAILAQYRERWAVEITIRDSNAFAGFGQDQCRKRERVVGANTLRLVLAAARTLWFVEQTSADGRRSSCGSIGPGTARNAPPVATRHCLDLARSLAGCGSFSHTTVHPSVLPKFRRSPNMLYL